MYHGKARTVNLFKCFFFFFAEYIVVVAVQQSLRQKCLFYPRLAFHCTLYDQFFK